MSTRTDGAAARFLADTGGAGSDERPCVQWVRWDAWHTVMDERTCGVCAGLNGQWFREDDGPWPGLHGNCRCWRETGVYWECVSRGESTRSGGGTRAQ